MFTFEPRIDFGIILQTAAIVAGGIFFVYQMRIKIDALGRSIDVFTDRLEKIDKQIEFLGKTVIDLARLEERMNHIDGRMQEISNRVVRSVRSKR